MKEVTFYVLSWLFSISLNAMDTAATSSTQTFSKPHIEIGVTEQAPARLKEIDVLNPLFILK